MSVVPALERGLEIISKVALGKYTIAELETELDIPKASFGRLMKCLFEQGFVNIDSSTRMLSVGDDFTLLAMEAYENSTVWREGNASVNKLSARWQATFVIHEYIHPFKVYWRVKSVPPGGINTRPPGFCMQGLNSNAQGQLFLSTLTEEQVKEFFQQGLCRMASEYTLKSYEEILPRLDEIRKLGYACQERENNAFMKQVAVPLKLRGSASQFCLTCYLPLDFEEVEPLRNNMLFEAARVSGTE